MCGISGFWGGEINKPEIARRMAEEIYSRGPDSFGVWHDEDETLAMSHRRLAIIDLSPAGHQPMVSRCGRFVLVFNGEIYNHLDLRKELKAEFGCSDWRGHSDTETLLVALCFWGVESTLSKVNGMFAFAFWDSYAKDLYLARDRIGEKPLYYGVSNGAFLFGSQLKALTIHPSWSGDINRDALALYVRHCYVPSPWSIYTGILKLKPGHFIRVSDNGCCISEQYCYWDIGKIAKDNMGREVHDVESLIAGLDNLLRDAVLKRMAADVPLGAFLSGGFDSSLVAALMQDLSRKPINTFTIGFNEKQYNEAQHAKAVARYLGTNHTELYVDSTAALGVIPEIPRIYDEPFSDSSQIPTYLVSKLAREYVAVSLSGDGGDELFCGYNRYVLGLKIWGRLRLFPHSLRVGLANMLQSTMLGNVLSVAQHALPRNYQVSNLPDRLPKLADVLLHESGGAFYKSLVSHEKRPEQLVLNSREPTTILTTETVTSSMPDLREKMMYWDMMTYLPDDILTKVDRATMHVSLEARVPMLDHRVIEFAWQIPTDLKYRDGVGKWILRQVLYKYVPQKLMDRPKKGFGVPIEGWLRGPLREWANELLSERKLKEQGFFNSDMVQRMWQEHTNGTRRWHYRLWDILMFQAWLEEQGLN